ncbi:magnesium transporter MgtE N-terminal domain-containing protein [Paenibacillus senegalensis]|uniref:magnesium transporter MgtE N-terminal domain-containing protein n=1 Tax=Paenibacillus senegalensis TaxID=1465766 RepID=UPI000287D106|nr:hypothetical protein [Paenibacillus senegalensis]
METELEKSETSNFERFFYWFLMPVVFITVLALIYLYVFDEPFKEKMQRAVASVPFVGAWFEPKDSEELLPASEPGQQEADELAALQEELQERDTQVAELQAMLSEKETELAELMLQMESFTEQQEQEIASDEEYRQQIKQISSLYARMMPSKAAAIMESLTPSERVLFLNEMRADDRSKILEKMDPELAAEATVGLKDQVSAKDLQIAALQERLQQTETDTSARSSVLNEDDLGATFASMAPEQAAAILLAMNSTHPQKVLDILQMTSNEARSRIVAAMSEEDNSQTAALVARLAP